MTNTEDDDAKLIELHERWAKHAQAMIDETDADPGLVAEAMLTIATSSMLATRGDCRTALALISAYGPICQAIVDRGVVAPKPPSKH